MIHNEAENIENVILETLKNANTQAGITQGKISTREQVIAKLVTLLTIAFERGTNKKTRGGQKAQQKWFSISSSLAQTLARLVSDLEYESLRMEYEELKKQVLEEDVSQGTPLPQTGLRATEKTGSEQEA